MIDGGVLIMIVSLAIMFTPRGHGSHVIRRPASTIIASAALRTACPPTMPPAQLTELVARADAALEQDSLTSGLRGISAVYRP
jgi:hypothetical protein